MYEKSSIHCENGAWYLIHCKPRKELYAANMLREVLHLSVYIPEYRIRSRGEVRFAPFFPGYIFVQADLTCTPLSKINATPGIVRLVDFGGGPDPISQSIVEEIAQRLEQVNAGLYPFRPGDIVRVKRDSPIQELEMIFVGATTPSKRVCVLLSILGRMKKVFVDVDTLEKVNVPMARIDIVNQPADRANMERRVS